MAESFSKKLNSIKKMKKSARIAFFTLTFGWFPFMWLSLWGSKQSPDTGFIIFAIGLVMCLLSSYMLSATFRNEALFKTLEELEAEKYKLYVTRKKLEKKISEL